MIEYVVGFMFDTTPVRPRIPHRRVLLIEKTRPKWQAGKLNGVGGKIEPGETPAEAMAREFVEETGIVTLPDDWTPIVILDGCQNHHRSTNDDRSLPPEPWQVHFFRAEGPIHTARTTTDEEVVIVDVPLAPAERVVPNLRWLVPLALQWEFFGPIVMQEAA